MSERDTDDVDLLVVGGGKAGKSLAMDRARAGWRVAMVERDIAHGVEVRLGARAEKVRRDATGEVVATLADRCEVRAAQLLCATGRTPVTAELNLDAAGVKVNQHGYVVADDLLRTTADHVWSAGDVAGSPQFTHASWNDFRILKENLTGTP